MRAKNASLKSTGSGRPTIPEWMIQPFNVKGEGELAGVLVPLKWKKELHLPPERSLEAWYFFAGGDDTDWLIDPGRWFRESIEYDPLNSFVFEASLVAESRKRRLVCKDLLTDLGKRSNDTVWIVSEPLSFSVWSDAAFQIWHDRITS